jgi:hypothetical protein
MAFISVIISALLAFISSRLAFFNLRIETDLVSKTMGSLKYQMMDKVKKLTNSKWGNFVIKSNEYKCVFFFLQLVEYKQQTRLEEKRKKALDQHLSFIVDQTEKYSTWLAESMNKSGVDSVNPSVPASVNSSRISSPIRQVLSDGMLMMCSVLYSVLFCAVFYI